MTTDATTETPTPEQVHSNGSRVTFTVPTRAGRSSERAGEVVNLHKRSKGKFYEIKADDGHTVFTRPALVKAAPPLVHGYNLKDPASLLTLLDQLTQALGESQTAIARLQPKVAARDCAATLDGDETITNTAQVKGIWVRLKALFGWRNSLRRRGGG